MFGKWTRKSSLDQLKGRGRVKLQARVVSQNVVESPLTGLCAAALEWRFFVRSVRHSTGQATYPLHAVRELYLPVGSRRLGEELVLESGGKLIQVLLRDADLRFPHARDGGRLVNRDLSPDFSYLIDNAAPRRQVPLVYHELALSEGDRVTLIGTVEPLPKERSGPYRSSYETRRAEAERDFQTRPDFAVRADLGPLVIEDHKGEAA